MSDKALGIFGSANTDEDNRTSWVRSWKLCRCPENQSRSSMILMHRTASSHQGQHAEGALENRLQWFRSIEKT